MFNGLKMIIQCFKSYYLFKEYKRKTFSYRSYKEVWLSMQKDPKQYGYPQYGN